MKKTCSEAHGPIEKLKLAEVDPKPAKRPTSACYDHSKGRRCAHIILRPKNHSDSIMSKRSKVRRALSYGNWFVSRFWYTGQ
jgi:hypothetical protein